MIERAMEKVTRHVLDENERHIARALKRVLPVGVPFDKIPPDLKRELMMIHRADGGLNLKFGDVEILKIEPPSVVMDDRDGAEKRWILEITASHFTINGDEI